MDPSQITENLKAEAVRLGFDAVGVCPAERPEGVEHLARWLKAGYAGRMDYIANRAEAYEHPRHVLEGVQSLVMLAVNYRTAEPNQPGVGQGSVSRYAWGEADYHDVIHQRLKQLGRFLQEQVAGAHVRGVVDTAPLLEREFAQRAGLGWIGKNTMLINKRAGSWFFLAALLTDVPLQYDRPHEADHCGTCRACLDACPTGALCRPHVLDATRCISYLTIELRESISVELREGLGDRLFGCDACQQVCPFNRRSAQTDDPQFAPRGDSNPVDLAPLFDLDDETFRQRFRRTALWRSKRRGIVRNAAIVLGNRPSNGAIDALVRGLNDSEPLVRSACAWALGRYEQTRATNALQDRLTVEEDDEVRNEIEAALRSRG